MTPGQTDSAASGCNVQAYPRVDLHRNAAKRANPRFCPLYRHCGAWHDAMPGLLAKKGKTVFFLFCGKQAKINALIFLFYCVSSILSVKGWGLPAVLAWHDAMLFYCGQVTGAGLNTAS
ncbi:MULTISPECIES: hypothetical protein [Tenebrionibacter/Tenebrionicola group]|jgi:hypothetical protein|uniref:Uncharacterized protein n=2 Tax=Tenebrionibacter/Tenebrionicola group TaxID=2969848 RepID=A0A8K0V4D0_9ENTR|nr:MULTISPECIES: hypothetical protein [Tenebrionibacter/Tenebrionicola group]MBK4715168.1 hypothetical protein [Tenebrionibacter intestinalis]MBV5095867.1 hypothetical protein [Tenebrionicola larvae]